jgi:AcrR family transcriptional regulator
MRARAEAAEATASRILDSAVELFTEQAFEDVSLDRVADAAGVTKRTVLRRFGSKEELFVTAMDHAVDEMRRRLDAAPVGDIAGAIQTYVAHYERWGANRLRMIEQEDRIPVVRENAEGGREYHRAWIERVFAPQLSVLSGEERERSVLALIVLTDVFTWKKLRLDLAVGHAETERTLIALTNTLLKGEA